MRPRIASMCDNVACSEIVDSLGLHDDPHFESIEFSLSDCEDQIIKLEPKMEELKQDIKRTRRRGVFDASLSVNSYFLYPETEERRREARKTLKESKERLKTVHDDQSVGSSTGRKRKNINTSGRYRKRHKASSPTSDDDTGTDSSDSSSTISDDDDSRSYYSSSDWSDSSSKDARDSAETLKMRIDATKTLIKQADGSLRNLKAQKKAVTETVAQLKKTLAKAQKDKTTFCSLKRSEVRYLDIAHLLSHFSISFLDNYSRTTSDKV
jgi:chromosome segregation ATPase